MLKTNIGIRLNEWEINNMNDAVTFAMLWYEIMLTKGYVINNTPEQISIVSKMYDDWCEKFYRGTV